jgi:hypothetical protein
MFLNFDWTQPERALLGDGNLDNYRKDGRERLKVMTC